MICLTLNSLTSELFAWRHTQQAIETCVHGTDIMPYINKMISKTTTGYQINQIMVHI